MTTAIAIACQCGAVDGADIEVMWSVQLGRDVCLDCYGRLAPPPVRDPVRDHAADALGRAAKRQREREARERAALAIDELATCERIAASARADGRRAMVDTALWLVTTECPHCGHGGDPEWLPFAVIPRWDVTIFQCRCCGHRRVDGRR